jgi:hypothetical protein
VIPINKKDQGAQGIINKCKWNKQPAVLKMSNNVDFLIELEHDAWSRLKTIDCPHFCEIFEKKAISAGQRQYFLVMKEISIGVTNESLGGFIYKNGGLHDPSVFINCINQTLAAIIMFEKVGITHYDLHVDNVMITNTPYDVHVYRFESGDVAIKTNGICPVIIDFGISYVAKSQLNATCVFTDSGFTPFMPDPLVDARLLLITAEKELHNMLQLPQTQLKISRSKTFAKNVQFTQTYTRFIKSTFKPLNLDWNNGWFKNGTFPNIIKNITDSIDLGKRGGILHNDNLKWMIELLQHEIEVPLVRRRNTVPFVEAVRAFEREWISVENAIRNTKEEELFFKDLVMMADTNVLSFKRIHLRYPKIKNLYRVKSTIKAMALALEHILIKNHQKIEAKKKKLYDRLSISTTSDILTSLPKPPIEWTTGMKLLIMTYSKPRIECILTSKNVNIINELGLSMFLNNLNI